MVDIIGTECLFLAKGLLLTSVVSVKWLCCYYKADWQFMALLSSVEVIHRETTFMDNFIKRT